jgi:hypothetical protein
MQKIWSLQEKRKFFFRRKLARIPENCDHNIEPRPGMPAGNFGRCGRKVCKFFLAAESQKKMSKMFASILASPKRGRGRDTRQVDRACIVGVEATRVMNTYLHTCVSNQFKLGIIK